MKLPPSILRRHFEFLWLVLVLSLPLYFGCGRKGAKLADAVKAFSTNNIVEVRITQDQLWTNSFTAIITNSSDIETVRKGLAQVDNVTVSGHSGPIYECTLSMRLLNGETVAYLGTVHKYETNDLFLSDTFWRSNNGGDLVRENPRRVRVPGLGQWMINKEPRGRLPRL